MTDNVTDDVPPNLDRMLAATILPRLALRYREPHDALRARALALVAQARQAYEDAGTPDGGTPVGFVLWLIDHPIVVR